MVILPDSTKQVIMVELTIHHEEHMDKAHKKMKMCQARGSGRAKHEAGLEPWYARHGLIVPGGITWARVSDVERPETPKDPRIRP